MGLIQLPEIGLKLFRRYRLSQPHSGILAEEIVPVTIVDDLADYETKLGRLCYGGWEIGATGGQFGHAKLEVPKKRNDILINVLGMYIGVNSTTATSVDISIIKSNQQTVAVSTTMEKSYADFAIAGQPEAAGGGGTSATQPTGPAIMRTRFRFDGTSAMYVPLNVTLGFGGDAGTDGSNRIVVRGDTVNVGLEGGWVWREGSPQG